MNPQDLVAFEGIIELAKWSMTSAAGAKITFSLADREALAPFEHATKRRGKRAGQRYRAILHREDGDPIDQHPDEFWFLGANWSNTAGAVIAFALPDREDLWWFAQQGAADERDAAHGVRWHMTLVELGEDDAPINQAKLKRIEDAKAPRGGANSKFVAMRNNEFDFRRFIALKMKLGQNAVATAEQADAWVKTTCGIRSKIEFDHDDAAWRRYRAFCEKPFLHWAHPNGRV